MMKPAASASAWTLRGTQHPCDNAPLPPTQPILPATIQLVPNNRCIAGKTSLFPDLESGGQPWLLWVKNRLSTPTAGLPRREAFSAVSPTAVFPKPLQQSWGKNGPCLLGNAASPFSLMPSSTVHGGNPHPRGLFCLRGSAEPCSSARSHFKGENSEARRQSRPSQGAQPAKAAQCPNLRPLAPPLHYAAHPGPRGRTHRHEPLVLIQTLPAGCDEQAPVLDPACVQPRLLLQVAAHHLPRVRQELHLHITGPQLPQQAWRAGGGRGAPSAPH